MADSGSDARGREHRGTGSHTVPPPENGAQRSAARIAASMPGNANEKPESSSFPGITR